MYIKQSRLNAAYIAGAETFQKNVFAELYSEMNGMREIDDDISDRLLMMLYAANTIRAVKGDYGNEISRDGMLDILRELSTPHQPSLSFDKPVVNRHTCKTQANRNGTPHFTLVNESFSQTTDVTATVYQFFQQVGLDQNAFTQEGVDVDPFNPFIGDNSGQSFTYITQTPVIRKTSMNAFEGNVAVITEATGISVNNIISITRGGIDATAILVPPAIPEGQDVTWNAATANATFASDIAEGEKIVLTYLSYI